MDSLFDPSGRSDVILSSLDVIFLYDLRYVIAVDSVVCSRAIIVLISSEISHIKHASRAHLTFNIPSWRHLVVFCAILNY